MMHITDRTNVIIIRMFRALKNNKQNEKRKDKLKSDQQKKLAYIT